MRIISKRRLREFWQKNPDAETSLRFWHSVSKRVIWRNPAEMKRDFAFADLVGNCTVFDIKGNYYRLIVKIEYAKQTIYIKHVLSHKEYDKEKWKEGCGKKGD
ncbi:MAG: type II toxin-antitoxin system HigB family toxin [Acidobacteria bacterium]|nr:type II toxin-antitoxin system HigB family toxin [Acidobacteriota bacterium]